MLSREQLEVWCFFVFKAIERFLLTRQKSREVLFYQSQLLCEFKAHAFEITKLF